MFQKFIPVVAFFMTTLVCAGQKINVYPGHWWTGMKTSRIQLILHSDQPGQLLGRENMRVISSSKDFRILKVTSPENKRYLFVDVEIAAGSKPQKINLSLGVTAASEMKKIVFELKARNTGDGKTRIQGIKQSDLIYLLIPDRFANSDTSNDVVAGMRDLQHDRNNPFDRHGGDLKGIEANLDYFLELGVTAIWPTPVVENDMARTVEGGTSRSTYHGYAFTDQYQIDRRFGGNAAYLSLVNAAHTKGLKFIQDAVYNHVGKDHWSILDLPMKDWVNQWPVYTNTSYREQPIVDPHASLIDRKVALDGWFTPFLADLNQRNPYVEKFLIQYAIWATEEFGIDGWRVDTYFYNDPEFLNRMNLALFKEFPSLTVFGETLVPDVINAAYFSQNNLTVPFKHNCPGVTDFPLCNAFLDALRQKPGSDGNQVSRIYSTLAQDFLYKDPSRNCIFLDNHDLDRVYSIIGEDYSRYKMAINWLLTVRGIPELYYGTELLMKNMKNPTDAEVRKDFPGGWPGDSANKFRKEGRTMEEQAAFTYVSALAKFRKNSSAIGNGKMMQYLPQKGVYIYFRYDSRQTVMVVSNTGSAALKPDWNYFSERTDGFTKIRNVISGEISSLNELHIQPQESFVFELLK